VPLLPPRPMPSLLPPLPMDPPPPRIRTREPKLVTPLLPSPSPEPTPEPRSKSKHNRSKSPPFRSRSRSPPKKRSRSKSPPFRSRSPSIPSMSLEDMIHKRSKESGIPVDANGNLGNSNLFIKLPRQVLNQVWEEMEWVEPYRSSESYNMVRNKIERSGVKVQHMTIPRYRNPHGYCYVTMDSVDDATKVMKYLDGSMWKDGWITVRYNKWK